MGRKERERGVRGEILWRDVCRKEGFENVERGCQLMQKGSEVADVVGLPHIHQEVKFVQRLNVRAAVEQARHDAEESGQGELPIVAHKTNRKPWIVSMLASDWFKLYRAFVGVVR